MAKRDDNDTSWTGWLIGMAMAVVFGAACLFVLLAPRLLFWAVKRPVTEALGLERRSVNWARYAWFYRTVLVVAGTCFVLLAAGSLLQLLDAGHNPASVVKGITAGLVSLIPAFVVAMIVWIEDYAEDANLQKKLAGLQAEETVRRLLEKNSNQFHGCRLLHNLLLVFRRGTAEEFSAECDHVVITTRHIYIVETKYKSGTIHVEASAPTWKTEGPGGEGSMRNALIQAKNSCRVLLDAARLQTTPIPVVAIVGQQLALQGAPGNVVDAQQLISALLAFEATAGVHAVLVPEEVATTLLSHATTADDDWARHVERAKAARERAQAREIVRTASLL